MMMRISVLLLAVWLHLSSSRRLRDTINSDNGISNSLNYGRPKDWVRISQSPVPILSKPVGSRVEIECEIVGSPAPSVQWLKGNTPITENDSYESNMISDLPTQGIAKVKSRLIIPAVLTVHESTYTCLAESGSQIATANTRLYVTRNGVADRNFTQLLNDEILGSRQPPRITLFYTTYMDVIGNDVLLPCKTVGNPQPSVVWLNANGQIIDDDRATIMNDGSLSLRNIRWADMGPYQCVARNVIGHDDESTFLYPMLADK